MDPRTNLPGPDDPPADRESSAYADRIDRLAREAQRARGRFEPPADPPDAERALEFCRDGLGEVVAVYVEAHAGEGWTAFSADELEKLHRATGDYLELYAACHGVDVDARVTVREAAEVLLDTHDIVAVARTLTGVPGRGSDRTRDERDESP